MKQIKILKCLTVFAILGMFFTYPLLAQSPTPVIGDIIIEVPPPPVTPVPTATRIPDDIPPVTTLVINGTQGKNNWYQSTVELIFDVTDDLSGISITWYKFNDETEWRRYEYWYPPVNITTEGVQTVHYFSEDKNENMESVQTTTLKIDYTPPTITLPIDISEPYSRCGTIPYNITDIVGVTEMTATFDGEVITEEVDLFTESLGHHTLSITATDQAGWVTTATQEIVLSADIPGLICTKHRLYDEGEIYGPGAHGIVVSLDAKLDAAQRSIDKGNIHTAINQLNAFINEAEAQRGQKITPSGADLMINDAQLVIALLERGEYQAMALRESRVYLPMLVKK